MKIVHGIDLVYIPRFKRSLKSGGENFLRRVFLESELNHPRGEVCHLAGIFAAKEAVIKALGLPVDSWHDIRISWDKNGSPIVKILNFKLSPASLREAGWAILNCSLSISHDGNYVVTQFVGILKGR